MVRLPPTYNVIVYIGSTNDRQCNTNDILHNNNLLKNITESSNSIFETRRLYNRTLRWGAFNNRL